MEPKARSLVALFSLEAVRPITIIIRQDKLADERQSAKPGRDLFSEERSNIRAEDIVCKRTGTPSDVLCDLQALCFQVCARSKHANTGDGIHRAQTAPLPQYLMPVMSFKAENRGALAVSKRSSRPYQDSPGAT